MSPHSIIGDLRIGEDLRNWKFELWRELVNYGEMSYFVPSGYSNTPRPDLRPSLPAFTYCTSSGHGRNFSPRLLCRYSRICRRVSRPTRSTSSNGPMG